MSWFEILLLSFIEGLTEFLPVSSTGHLILVSKLFHFTSSPEFTTQFNIIIQFGAILSVVILYSNKFFPKEGIELTDTINFYLKIITGMIPAAIIGLLIKDKIDLLLDSTLTVSIALIIGGFILLELDRKNHSGPKLHEKSLSEMTFKDSFYIGLFQCFAFIPGVSRSAASIFGARLLKFNFKTATEFSFFLAVPTITGAALIKTIKIIPSINSDQVLTLIGGIVLSFIFASIAIKTFIHLLSKGRVFKWFGIYRIALGLISLYFIMKTQT